MMVNGLHLGGIRTVIDNVVSVLQKRHQISLFIGQDQSGKRLYELEEHQEGEVDVCSVNIYKFRNTRRVENYSNRKVEKPFRKFLSRIKPDIVHFHSCDCIGASVVKLVKDLRIPCGPGGTSCRGKDLTDDPTTGPLASFQSTRRKGSPAHSGNHEFTEGNIHSLQNLERDLKDAQAQTHQVAARAVEAVARIPFQSARIEGKEEDG